MRKSIRQYTLLGCGKGGVWTGTGVVELCCLWEVPKGCNC